MFISFISIFKMQSLTYSGGIVYGIFEKTKKEVMKLGLRGYLIYLRSYVFFISNKNVFIPVNIKVKYLHSSEFNELVSYDKEFEEVNKKEKQLRYDDSLLKNTILDKSHKMANTAVLDMIDKFRNTFFSMFLKEHDFNAYTYYDNNSKKMMYDSFSLYSNDKKVEYKDIFDENILKDTKSVVSVLYKKNDGKVFIADHKHEEDSTFGYPSVFNSVPGGRRDSNNPLSTFFSEAYEELRLGNKGINFFDNSVIKGYQLNEHGALFVFCEVQENAELNNVNEDSSFGFKPYQFTSFLSFTIADIFKPSIKSLISFS